MTLVKTKALQKDLTKSFCKALDLGQDQLQTCVSTAKLEIVCCRLVYVQTTLNLSNIIFLEPAAVCSL